MHVTKFLNVAIKNLILVKVVFLSQLIILLDEVGQSLAESNWKVLFDHASVDGEVRQFISCSLAKVSLICRLFFLVWTFKNKNVIIFIIFIYDIENDLKSLVTFSD